MGLKPRISASLMCADLLNLEKQIRILESAEVDYIHYDVMDGTFVPNITLGIDLFNQIRSISNLSMDVHFLTVRPMDYIPRFIIRPGDIVSVHYESDAELAEVADYVHSKGALFGIAISSDVSTSELIVHLKYTDVFLVMMILI